MNREQFEEYVETLTVDERLELLKTFFSAYELTSPSPSKERNKQLYQQLAAYLELNDPELLAFKEAEWAADLARVRAFIEEFVANAA